ASDLFGPLFRCRRRPHELRGRLFRGGSPSRCLYWSDSQRRQASRAAGAAIHEGRVGPQSQNRQGARSDVSHYAARSRRRGDRMRRREFIAGLGGAAVWPFMAGAQQPGKLPTIGFIGGRDWTDHSIPFLRRLGELGWVEGRNILVEFRWL